MSAGIELDHYLDAGPILGGTAFSRTATPVPPDLDPEGLRRQAWAMVNSRTSCMQRAHEAYQRGDGAAAKELSNEGKRQAAKADDLFKRASKIIFDANNNGTQPDAIDLHGLYVADAVKRVEERVIKDRSEGKTHLHVIVGQGIHSVDHIQRIKPAIEQLCENLGLEYATEENAGRIYVNLQGGNVTNVPSQPDKNQDRPQHHDDPQEDLSGQQQQHRPSKQKQHRPSKQRPHRTSEQRPHRTSEQRPHRPSEQRPHRPSEQRPHRPSHHSEQNQEEEQYDDIERFLKKLVNKYCCTVM
ncbi:DUF1771-domain-containing protein [Xylaria cf. heliscus]|nr:DUF1771-domain-containing protein [Xylaria cf. heliscus]